MREALMFFMVLAVGLSVTTLVTMVAWVRARTRAVVAEARLESLQGGHARTGDPLSNAVDALALEVERIGEGQRFLTRLLGDQRLEPSRPSGRDARPDTGGRIITPH